MRVTNGNVTVQSDSSIDTVIAIVFFPLYVLLPTFVSFCFYLVCRLTPLPVRDCQNGR